MFRERKQSEPPFILNPAYLCTLNPSQVEWLRERVQAIPVRLVFESALELMGSTQIGSFTMSSKPGEKKGPPPVIQKV